MKVKDLTEVMDFESSRIEFVKVTYLDNGEIYTTTVRESEERPLGDNVKAFFGDYDVLEFRVGYYGGTTMFLTLQKVVEE